MNKKQRRTFSGEQKSRIALELITNKKTITELCRDEDLVPGVIYAWRDQIITSSHLLFNTNKTENETDLKLKKYETTIAKLVTQNDFLDKVLLHLK
jgi:transposase-like protein